MGKKRVLIVFYSFTQQTKLLLRSFKAGLESEGVHVTMERLLPLEPYSFPFRSNFVLTIAMIKTFFKVRMKISPVGEQCYGDYDCVIMAGPTWSYHPSGPVLDFLDRYGKEVCGNNKVIPFISCRSYWRLHCWEIKRHLQRCNAIVETPIVYTHPTKEPWRLIGLVLQLRGKMVRRENSWFRKHYPGYGHDKQQGQEAMVQGAKLAGKL